MEFHDYLESEYVRTNIALQQVYHPYGQGKINATQGLIHAQRRFFTWMNYFVILSQYALVKLHLKSTPATAKEMVATLTAKKAEIKEEAKTLDLERQANIQDHLEAQKAAAHPIASMEG